MGVRTREETARAIAEVPLTGLFFLRRSSVLSKRRRTFPLPYSEFVGEATSAPSHCFESHS